MRPETKRKLDSYIHKERSKHVTLLGIVVLIGLLPFVAKLALPALSTATSNAIHFYADVALLVSVGGLIIETIVSWLIWGFRVQPVDVFTGLLVSGSDFGFGTGSGDNCDSDDTGCSCDA